MKSRTFMIFFITTIVTLLEFPATSRAVTFPITYEGTAHVKVTSVFGDCEGDYKMKITLNKNGTLREEDEGYNVTFYVGRPCEFTSGYDGWREGTYNEAAGTFDVKIGLLETSGSYDDEKITGHGSFFDGYISTELSFTLPKVQTISQYPVITLEPATYPEFQMNILEGKGFTVKIRKEDGVKDSQGNWKLNWSTLIFATDGVDNSMNFVKKIADIVFWIINDDGKEVIFHITPNQKYFMLDHNVFNIQSNGVHKIGFQICDTDGRCGKSEYNIYFGPFFSAKSVRDMRCTDFSYSLELSGGTFGNIGHPSPRNTLYIVLQNAVYPDNIWSCYDSSGYQIWEEGSLLPVWDNMIALATGDLWTTEYWFLNLTNSFHYNENKKQEFPAGDYIFYAVPIDNDSGALGGFFSQAVKTCLSGIDDI